jgi:ABC-type oligopeptide transport system substrate-binding subunit
MLKKIIALLLCVLMMIPVFSSCAKRNEDDLGPVISMYLSDEIYNFDPAYAHYNASARNIVSLLFETLFKLDSDGKIQKGLVDEYEYIEIPEKNTYKMVMTLKNTCWSNKDPVTTENVLYAWKRLLTPTNSFEAASLLFDIKNARAAKEGDVSIDDIGVEANSQTMLTVTFEGPIDVDAFLLTLTSVATAPLPEGHIEKDADWAKKGSTMICSGPFKLGKTRYVTVDKNNMVIPNDSTDPFIESFIVTDDYDLDASGKPMEKTSYSPVKKLSTFILERNNQYYRDPEEDAIDKVVTPHRMVVNCRMSDAELEEEFKNGHIFYLGDIPCSMRGNKDSFVMQNVTLHDTMSTLSLYFNQNALINDGSATGSQLFANKDVRQALSLAIDRQAIADAVVFGRAATGLVPYGVLEAGIGKNATMFRDNANNSLISTTANMEAAKSLLANLNITPANYSFSITVASYNQAHIIASRMIAKAWCELGFNVSIKEGLTIENNDILKALVSADKPNDPNAVSKDICDDLFVESITRNTFEVVAFDYTAHTPDAYSVLSGFAKSFSGMAVDMLNYELTPHRTGYDSKEYNDLMEAVYYIPYFANLNRETSSDFLGIYDTEEEFQAVYDAVAAIYNKYGITPTTNAESWKTQKAVLLHKAEELLLSDLPVVPVIFNQTAYACNSELVTDLTSDYYVPVLFTNATVKDYFENQYYVNNQGKSVSIFANFPEVAWDKANQNN